MSLEPAGGQRWVRSRTWLVPVAGVVVGLAVGFGVARVVGVGSSTDTVTVTAAPRVTAAQAPAAPTPAARARVRLVILNGTEVTGLAGRAAARAHRLGYRAVTVGNGPRVAGRSQTWFRAGARGQAATVARDFATRPPRALAAGSPLLAQTPAGRVFVLLGPPRGG